MGTYDTVLLRNTSVVLPCAEGHPVTEFQTKDLACAMSHYVITGDGLSAKLYSRGDQEEEYVDFGTEFSLIWKFPLREETTTTEKVRVYSNCKTCLPVLFDNGQTTGWSFHGQIDERSTWVEYNIVIEKGIVKDFMKVRIESREDIRNELLKQGIHVFADDDYLAKKHFETRRK